MAITLGKRRRFVSGSRSMKRARNYSIARRTGIQRSLIRRRRNPTYNFKRKAYVETISVGYGAGNILGAYTFALNKLPNYTEFTALFDRYRICGVLVEFMPAVDSFSTEAGVSMTNFALPQVRTIIDHTEDGVPTDFNEMYQYKNCKMTQGNRIHKRFLKPAVLTSAFESTIATAYIPKWKQWITTDDPATPHYCLKYGINALPSAAMGTMTYRVYATYYLQCKDLK